MYFADYVNEYLNEIRALDVIEKAFENGQVHQDIFEKARSGVYADNAENRRLKRVGQKYGSKKQEEPSNKKEGKEDDKTEPKQKTPDELANDAKNASENQLQAAIKESNSPEVRQAAHNELKRRQEEEHPQEEKFGEQKKEQPLSEKPKTNSTSNPDKKESKSVSDNKEGGEKESENVFKNILNELSDKDIENIKNFGETEIQVIKNLGLNDDIINEIGGIKNIDVSYSNYLNSLTINIDFGKGKMERKFYGKKEGTKFSKPHNPFVFNSELKFDKSIQGKGVGTKIFNNQIASLREQGNYSKIETETSNGEETGEKLNGHYTWAKLGFKMFLPKDKSAFDDLMNNNNRGEKNLEELMSTDKGREFWKKNGFTYRGVVDLIDKENKDKIKKSEEQDILVHEFSGNIDIKKTINTYEKWL